MKTLILMILMSATACVVDAPVEATSGQGLVCDPDCGDPGGAQPVINELMSYGYSMGCAYINTPAMCNATSQHPDYQQCYTDCYDRYGNPGTINCSGVPGGGCGVWWY